MKNKIVKKIKCVHKKKLFPDIRDNIIYWEFEIKAKNLDQSPKLCSYGNFIKVFRSIQTH